MRDAGALTDLYHFAPESSLGIELSGKSPEMAKVDRFWRVLDAYFGVRVVQEDEQQGASIRNYRLQRQVYGELKSRGAIGTPEEPRLRR
jgi:hypothetical protein